MSHTPGPWLNENESFVYALNEHGTNRTYILVQGGYADRKDRTSLEEMVSNARLIAAAPDLLGAAKEVYGWMNDLPIPTSGCTSKMQLLYDAIAKAEGKS